MIVEQFERRSFNIGGKDVDDRILALAQKKSAEGWKLVDVQVGRWSNIRVAIFEAPIGGSRIKRRTPKGWKA